VHLFQEKLAPSQKYTRDQLTSAALNWLEILPDTMIAAHELFVCHGDRFDAPYLFEQVEAAGVFLRRTRAIEASVAGIPYLVILSGHSHVSQTVLLPDGKLLVNPGSVGLPAYTMKAPVPYAMESGSLHARYALLQRKAHGWQVEHVQVPYPFEKAVRMAHENGRLDWAAWLSTGRGR
jgi:predicted phosphodiesterase